MADTSESSPTQYPRRLVHLHLFLAHRSLQKEPLSIQLLALAEQPREQPPLEQEDFGVCPALAYV